MLIPLACNTSYLIVVLLEILQWNLVITYTKGPSRFVLLIRLYVLTVFVLTRFYCICKCCLLMINFIARGLFDVLAGTIHIPYEVETFPFATGGVARVLQLATLLNLIGFHETNRIEPIIPQ